MIRHVERLRQAAPRLFVAMVGGGAGTFASLGAAGPAVQAGMGKHLGMPPMRVPSRTIGDHLAENICLFGLLAATSSKIAREIYTLMKTEPSPSSWPPTRASPRISTRRPSRPCSIRPPTPASAPRWPATPLPGLARLPRKSVAPGLNERSEAG